SGGGSISGGSYTAPLTGGSVVLTASYTENGVLKTADLTLTVSASTAEVTIQSVNSIADKNVANGTALSSVGLPATVKVTMSDDSTRDVAVTWDGGTPAYNATTAGTYTFSGTIAGTTLKASLKVIVAEAAAAAAIQSVETMADRNVDNGTALSAIGLPAKVVVTMTDASTKEVAVTWDGGTPAYNATTAGTYTFSGAIAGTTLKASLKVIVAEAAAATITSLATLNDKTVEVGTTIAGLNLPAQITAVLSDGATTPKNVTWDGGTPAYSSTTAGTYIFSGTVAGTTLKAQLTVVVIEVPSAPATIKSINALTDISVLNGTSLAAVNLPATVTVTMSNNTTRDVAVTWDGGSPAYSSTTAGVYTFSGTVADTTLKAQVCVVVSSSTTAAAELLIYTIEDLYAVRGEVAGHDGWNLGRNYKLMANLDFNSAASYSDPATYQSYFTTGKGWEPIGATDTPFYGTFDGNGHTVSNMMITDTTGNKGLFGVSRGQIKNLGVVNPKIEISGTVAIKNIGGLVGENNGMVRNCFVTGTDTSYIKSTGNYVQIMGGLVGYNNANGVIHDSYAGITVTSYRVIGGLVGLNVSTVYNGIARCHATGNISSSNTVSSIGGLIGKNGDASGKVHYVVDSYATGNVDSIYGFSDYYNQTYAGGLIGNAYDAKSVVNNCYATGNVTSNNGTLGGLIGSVSQYGEITNSYATGAVKGSYNIGGLVGVANNCTITGSHATGAVTSSYKSTTNYCTGGLIGIVSNSATITVKDSYATGNVSDDSPGNYSGGLIGSINTNVTKATISDCYASGSVTNKKHAGGLIGFAGVKATITRCYATGDTTGTFDTGGLIAYSNAAVNQCYASGTVKCDGGTDIETGTGGLIGTNGTGTITACYALNPMIIKYTTITSNYFSRVVGRCDLTSSLTANYANSAMIYRVIDKEDTTSFPGLMANSTTSIKGANVTLADAKTRASYEGNNWDFSYWRISEGIDFPKLSWQ
ncbi:MAG TPA: Ig-like domain-containing protein, partial [Candidatus Wallbacteria bacterium]|nr:Ig-like domain-containing protein [Candidatus Wallbacteria bacterium]